MNSKLSNEIKAEALRLGFYTCGIAPAAPVDKMYADSFRQRIKERSFADMEYMYANTDKRLDPTLLMPGVKSIVSVALNYAPAGRANDGELHLAAYALGKDYHDVIKRRMRQLLDNLGITDGYRCFVDTAPVLEQYWAQQCGIGWIGKNQQLIVPQAGNMFFLGEIFLDRELDYDQPMNNRCGSCHKCIDSCPTHALRLTADGGVRMDAGRCLSYQTIENRGSLSPEARTAMGNCFYGCDRCAEACPWNRFARPNNLPELQPTPELTAMRTEDWISLTEDEYRKLFKGSAVKRAKFTGLKRNIEAAVNNRPQPEGDRSGNDDRHT